MSLRGILNASSGVVLNNFALSLACPGPGLFYFYGTWLLRWSLLNVKIMLCFLDVSFCCWWQPVQDFTEVFCPGSVYLCFWRYQSPLFVSNWYISRSMILAADYFGRIFCLACEVIHEHSFVCSCQSLHFSVWLLVLLLAPFIQPLGLGLIELFLQVSPGVDRFPLHQAFLYTFPEDDGHPLMVLVVIYCWVEHCISCTGYYKSLPDPVHLLSLIPRICIW